MHCFSSGPGLARGGARSGVLPVDVGHRRLSPVAGAARHLRGRPARPYPAGNRQPLPCAAAPPRQAQRTGLYRLHRQDRGRGLRPRRSGVRRDAPARTSTGFSPRRLAPPAPPDGNARHDPRLRFIGRRAASGRPLGRVRSREPEQPPPPLLASGRTVRRGRHDARADRHFARHARPVARCGRGRA